MEIYVGTSGWYYSWNQDRTLDWYLQFSGLNAVELNASFYRFPFPAQVKSWAVKGGKIRWAVKVHRLVTHQHRFSPVALPIWEDFLVRMAPLDQQIDFYLFQTPPSLKATETILDFASLLNLGKRFALELRNLHLLRNHSLCDQLAKKFTLVSVDSPDVQAKIFPGETIYLRMHGRTAWYSHNYSRTELTDLRDKLVGSSPERIFVFFNNNHHMLENAQTMYQLLMERRQK
ncbi:MAG: DUF72 domain-containing protein [Candidatus Omnitrophica bacterium]|nr:DUF72 domain-containing protein [Candidatus Omnitrophota bacterium]MCM8770222.1 DUF72 domain-containing protein [Candidatus Omnitrophota bacterium]